MNANDLLRVILPACRNLPRTGNLAPAACPGNPDSMGEEIEQRGFDGVLAVDPIRGAVSSGQGVRKGALGGMLTASS